MLSVRVELLLVSQLPLSHVAAVLDNSVRKILIGAAAENFLHNMSWHLLFKHLNVFFKEQKDLFFQLSNVFNGDIVSLLDLEVVSRLSDCIDREI